MTTARIAAHATCHRSKAKTLPQYQSAREAFMPKNAEATARIRQLNDTLRSTFTGGKVVMTDGVAGLPENEHAQLLERVRSFNEFTNDNDPCGEHDFGSIELARQTFFFKMDYYALDMDGGSEDPADPAKTTRVLTIMRADEY
jgi:Protein of unknown function (DUF3768)